MPNSGAGVSFRIIAAGVGPLAKDLTGSALKAHAAIAKSTIRHGQLLVTSIKAHASGRPGPNAPTGDYKRSWTMIARSTPGGTGVVVGTNAPQGRRLEFGFSGADSLGRVYNQPPYPHVRPAIDEIEPRFFADVNRIIVKEVTK